MIETIEDFAAEFLENEEYSDFLMIFLSTLTTQTEDLIYLNMNDLVLEALGEFASQVENILDSVALENPTYEDLEASEVVHLPEASILKGEEIVSILIETGETQDNANYCTELLHITSFLNVERLIELEYLENKITTTDVFVSVSEKLKSGDFKNKKIEITSNGGEVYEVQFPESIFLPDDYYLLTITIYTESPFRFIDFSSSFNAGVTTNIASQFISATITRLSTFSNHQLEHLEQQIQITIPVQFEEGVSVNPCCVFVDENEFLLSGEGIIILESNLSELNIGTIKCSTDHLTSFSVTQEPVKIINSANFDQLTNVEALNSYEFYESAGKSYSLIIYLFSFLVCYCFFLNLYSIDDYLLLQRY